MRRDAQFRHICWEWDDMLIDEFGPEFESCLCYDSPTAMFHRNMWSLSHELFNNYEGSE